MALGLVNNNKRSWSMFSLRIGHYNLKTFHHAIKISDNIKELNLPISTLKKNDPQDVVKGNYMCVRLTYMYEHEVHHDDLIFYDVLKGSGAKDAIANTRIIVKHSTPRRRPNRKGKGVTYL